MAYTDTNEELRDKLEELLKEEPNTKLKAKIEDLLAPDEDNFDAWVEEVERFNTAFCKRFNKRNTYIRPKDQNFHVSWDYSFKKVTVNITAMETVIWVRIHVKKLWSVAAVDYALDSDDRLPIETYLDLTEGALHTLGAI